MPITNRHRNKDLPSQREWQERTRQRIRAAGIVEKGLKVIAGELTMNSGQLAVLKMMLPTILPAQTESVVENVVSEKPDMEGIRKLIEGSHELQAMLASMLPKEKEKSIPIEGDKTCH